jgi:hypothetical protein
VCDFGEICQRAVAATVVVGTVEKIKKERCGLYIGIERTSIKVQERKHEKLMQSVRLSDRHLG